MDTWCVIAAVVLVLSQSFENAVASQDETAVRARAWATISMIHDASIRTIEWDEEVTARDEVGEIVLFRARMFADEYRNIFIEGQIASRTTMNGEARVLEFPQLYSVYEGVNRFVDRERGSAVVGFERPYVIHPYGMPGVLRGLGYGHWSEDIRPRSELLLGSPELGIAAEDAETVSLRARFESEARVDYIEVDLMPRTGLVREERSYNTKWDVIETVWRVEEWSPEDGVVVPTRVLYEFKTPDITAEQRSRIMERSKAIGLPDAAWYPGHERNAEWRELRREVFGSEVRLKPQTSWQRSASRVLVLNSPSAAGRFVIDLADADFSIMSKATETHVRSLELESANGQ